MSETPAPLSPVKRARRDKILTVAEHLFRAQGYRATTMEGVAAQVGMSKVTVYSYFSDKDVLFEAVAGRIADRITEAVRDALAQDGALEKRLISALVGKHDLVFSLVRKSAFASELFAAKDQFAAAIFRKTDEDIEQMLIKALQAEGRPAARAKATGRLLFGASTGIANHAADGAEMATDIATLVRAVL